MSVPQISMREAAIRRGQELAEQERRARHQHGIEKRKARWQAKLNVFVNGIGWTERRPAGPFVGVMINPKGESNGTA